MLWTLNSSRRHLSRHVNTLEANIRFCFFNLPSPAPQNVSANHAEIKMFAPFKEPNRW